MTVPQPQPPKASQSYGSTCEEEGSGRSPLAHTAPLGFLMGQSNMSPDP